MVRISIRKRIFFILGEEMKEKKESERSGRDSVGALISTSLFFFFFLFCFVISLTYFFSFTL